MHLRDAEILVVDTLSPAEARAALDALFAAEEQRLREEAQRGTQTTRSQAEAEFDAQMAAAIEVADAQASANAQLQEALAALAKALSTSQCTTVGGTNGQPASISCPMEDGDATVVGDENVVVTPQPSPTPSTTPTPSATVAPTDDAEPMSAASLPDAPVGPEGLLSADALAGAVAPGARRVVRRRRRHVGHLRVRHSARRDDSR